MPQRTIIVDRPLVCSIDIECAFMFIVLGFFIKKINGVEF